MSRFERYLKEDVFLKATDEYHNLFYKHFQSNSEFTIQMARDTKDSNVAVVWPKKQNEYKTFGISDGFTVSGVYLGKGKVTFKTHITVDLSNTLYYAKNGRKEVGKRPDPARVEAIHKDINSIYKKFIKTYKSADVKIAQESNSYGDMILSITIKYEGATQAAKNIDLIKAPETIASRFKRERGTERVDTPRSNGAWQTIGIRNSDLISYQGLDSDFTNGAEKKIDTIIKEVLTSLQLIKKVQYDFSHEEKNWLSINLKWKK